MSIIRVNRHERDFMVVGNAVVRNRQLSFRARGLLVWMLSHPADTEFASEDIAKAGLEGRDAVRTAMKELRLAGHLVYRKERVEGGRLATVVDVYEIPVEGFDEGSEPVGVGASDADVPGFGTPVPDGIPADSDHATGDGLSGPGVTRGNAAKALVAPATGKPAAGFPGPYRNTQEKKLTQTSLRSVCAPDPAQPEPPLRTPADLEAAGWVESETTAFVFTHPAGGRADLLWDTLRLIVGFDPAELTPKARSAVNAALAELRGVGASPAEMILRARRYVGVYGRRPTAHHFAAKWPELGAAAQERFARRPQRFAAKLDQLDRLLGGAA